MPSNKCVNSLHPSPSVTPTLLRSPSQHTTSSHFSIPSSPFSPVQYPLKILIPSPFPLPIFYHFSSRILLLFIFFSISSTDLLSLAFSFTFHCILLSFRVYFPCLITFLFFLFSNFFSIAISFLFHLLLHQRSLVCSFSLFYHCFLFISPIVYVSFVFHFFLHQ